MDYQLTYTLSFFMRDMEMTLFDKKALILTVPLFLKMALSYLMLT
jgi:hypothetical protein